MRPVALAVCVVLSAAPLETGASPKVDLVLKGATVHTLDDAKPRAEAIAVAAGRIVAVGSDADVLRLAGSRTEILDLRGATVIPGLQDSHAHVFEIGLGGQNVDLTGAADFAEVVARVAKAAATRAAGEWILGRGWHEEKWSSRPVDSVRGFPTHEALSAAVPDHPVVLVRADGHAVLANARAMALRGITAATEAPSGGEIIRFDSTEPTGVFVDSACALVHPPEGAQGPEGLRRALELAMDEALAKGLTAITDAGTDERAGAVLKEAAEQGRLRVRIRAMAAGLETAQKWGRPVAGLGKGFLDMRSIKLFADGALGSRGAALLEPYDDDPSTSGLLVATPDAIAQATRWALPRGFQVATHAIGDRANRLVLDAYEAAMRSFPGVRDPRLRIEHAQVLDEADIPRFRRLGVIASMQGIHCPSDRPWAIARLGAERIGEGAYAWHKLLASGARIANGTDAPVEDLSPLASFFASVTRQSPKGEPAGGFDPEERMSRLEALRSYTLDGAYAAFDEERTGSIEVGKCADLTVLSADILAIPADQILATQVLMTIVDGKIAYRKESGGGAAEAGRTAGRQTRFARSR